jgi:Holliday junction resolvase
LSRRGLARLNAKRDANERLIIETLEARGFSVAAISGKGVPDLLVGFRHRVFGDRIWLVEVKQPKGKLNPAQVKWRERWNGPAPLIVRTVDEALAFPIVPQGKADAQ